MSGRLQGPSRGRDPRKRIPALGGARRLLLLAEGRSGDPHYGKTMRGVLRYRREEVLVILDSERAGETMDGVPVVSTVGEALAFEPTVALVGVATQGGRFPPAWRDLLRACLEQGLAVENGLHEFLTEDPELSALAARTGAELRDLRRPPPGLDVPQGANLELPARIVLTVGSDCAIGKMTVALELERGLCERGLEALFVPTGQTGIAIAGWGIAVDAVVADFIAGASERLVVEGHERGGEVLVVEGQGAISHPAYAGVTLGLLHGAAPHVLVLCHRAGATEVEGYPGQPLLPLPELVELYPRVALAVRRPVVACVALNTAHLDEDEARAAIAAVARETGLPTQDPVRFGTKLLVDAILAVQ